MQNFADGCYEHFGHFWSSGFEKKPDSPGKLVYIYIHTYPENEDEKKLSIPFCEHIVCVCVCFNIVNRVWNGRCLRHTHTWGIQNPHVDVDSIPNQRANPLCHPLDMTLKSTKDTKWNPSMIPGKKSREQVPNGMTENKILSWIDQFEVLQLSGSPWNGWLNQKVSYPLSQYALLLGQGASTHWKVAKFNMADLPPSPILSVPRWMQSRSKCILLLTIPSTSVLIIPENQLVTGHNKLPLVLPCTPQHPCT